MTQIGLLCTGGDSKQTQSFLFIDDASEALYKLMLSDQLRTVKYW